MRLHITSASREILDVTEFTSVTLMTESWEITILPNHEALLSVVRPGILHVEYSEDGASRTEEFATGGWVVQIMNDTVTIVADAVSDAESLVDIDTIEQKKAETAALVQAYRSENPQSQDAKRLMELEYDTLKYSAMADLYRRLHSSTGGRK